MNCAIPCQCGVGGGCAIERGVDKPVFPLLPAAVGIAVDIARATGRRHAYACRDLTERTHHVGGAIGAALCTHALSEGWVERIADTRALAITAQGREAFASLGISLDG